MKERSALSKIRTKLYYDEAKEKLEAIYDLMDDKRKERDFLEKSICAKIVEDIKRDKPSSELESLLLTISLDWRCDKSPISYCVYDEQRDPAHDDCIFCGLPQERK